MRSIKFYISIFMIIGLISLNSTSFAGERYNIDVENVKKEAQKSFWDGKADIKWNAKVKNNTDKSQTYEIKINFLNSENRKIHETTKAVELNPGEEKVVNNVINLATLKIRDIDSGYVTISEVNRQTLTAKLDKNLNVNINRLSDEAVSLAYTVKLKNNSDKSVTRDITVTFLDENNNWIKGETKKASFNAGESKMISNTLKLSAFDADRIAAGNVTIN